VLLRPAVEAFEVYVLRRATTMVFGGVHAFPGGGVDRNDLPQTVNQDWPERLGVPEAEAKAVVGAAARELLVVGAAARELFEEAGVLLAGPAQPGQAARTAEPSSAGEVAGDLVGDVSGADWEADRLAVQRRELTMTELLAKRGLRLRDDLLLPWARWITPEFEPKRFDTWFFVAVLPPAQRARDVSGEADRTMWISPAAADGLAMLPPTRVMLNDLSAYQSIDDVLRAGGNRDAAAPVMPRVELTEDGGVLRV
jgi:8-oxo-dGTP pyrophosphatase MutT (NUDIX family)